MLHTMLAATCAVVGLICFTARALCLPLRASGSWRLRLATGSLIIVSECEIVVGAANWIASI